MKINQAEFWLSILFPSLRWQVKTTEKVIYLTFDDGPIPVVTEYVLDLLKNYNAKGTFFCVGENVKKYPDIFFRIITDGHLAANHTYNHRNGWESQDQDYFENIRLAEETMGQDINYKPGLRKLFRPPYGKIKRSQLKVLQEKYEIIMWSVLTRDYDKNLPEEQCLKNALKLTQPGSVVVFHDSLKAEKNLRAVLPAYLEHFSSRGFTFKAL